MIKTTHDKFKSDISTGYKLVDFYAVWCGPCKVLAPTLEDIDEDIDGLDVVKFDADENDDARNITKELKVNGFPTCILFKDGEEVDRFVGALDYESIEEWVEGKIN